MYWSRFGVFPPARGAPAAPPAPAPAPAPTDPVSSEEFPVIAAKSLRSASAGIFCISLLVSPTSRASSGVETSATIACPLRICDAP